MAQATGDPLRLVTRGEPVKPKAAVHNAFIAAAKAHQQRLNNFIGGHNDHDEPTPVIIPFKNETSSAVRFQTMGISGPLINPTTAGVDNNRVTLIGVQPADPTHIGKFLIVTEPATRDAIGRGCISGLCFAYINILDTDHEWADASSLGILESDSAGKARIIWQPAGDPGVKLCIVNLGNRHRDLSLEVNQPNTKLRGPADFYIKVDPWGHVLGMVDGSGETWQGVFTPDGTEVPEPNDDDGR